MLTRGKMRAGLAAIVIGAIASVAVACGASTTPASSGAAVLRGEVEIDGSGTVFPITEAVAEEFRKVQPGVQVNVGVSGTGGGFKRFVVGETDISDASRPIKPEEATQATANGVAYVELKVGTDGLTVIAHPNADFVNCLTIDELKRIWEPGSQIDNWNQVRSTFPDQRMRLYGPDTDSGTFDYFTEAVMGEAQVSRADYTASADDNVLVQGIGGDRGSLGYFGYAYYAENSSKLKAIGVDAGKGCIAPTPGTIADGSYSPLSRPLYVYVNKQALRRPEVQAFVQFFMELGGTLTAEVGYVPEAADVYAENARLAAAQ